MPLVQLMGVFHKMYGLVFGGFICPSKELNVLTNPGFFINFNGKQQVKAITGKNHG